MGWFDAFETIKAFIAFTFLSLFSFTFWLIGLIVFMDYHHDYYEKEKFHFHCNTTNLKKARCYRQFNNNLTAFFPPSTCVNITCYGPLLIWVLLAFIVRVHAWKIDEKFKSNGTIQTIRESQNRPVSRISLVTTYIVHIFFRILSFAAVLIAFLCNRKLNIPEDFPCKLENQTYDCTDSRSKEKTHLNFGILGVISGSVLLALVELIQIIIFCCRNNSTCPSDRQFLLYLKSIGFQNENSHLEGSSTIAVQQVGPDSNQGRLEGVDVTDVGQIPDSISHTSSSPPEQIPLLNRPNGDENATNNEQLTVGTLSGASMQRDLQAGHGVDVTDVGQIQDSISHSSSSPPEQIPLLNRPNGASAASLEIATAVACIGDLSDIDIDEMSSLDHDHGSAIKNWWHLAAVLGLSQTDREELLLHYRGGGNPALDFIRNLCLQHGDDKCENLMQKLNQMKRIDVYNYLQEIIQNEANSTADVMLLQDLSSSAQVQLAKYLNDTKARSVKSWDYLAALYKYPREVISTIKTVVKEPGSYSPTKALFNKLMTKNSNLPLQNIVNALETIQRNDQAMKLTNIIEQINKEKLESQE